MSSTELDFAAIHAFTIALARKAGKMILEGSSKRTQEAATLGQPEIKKNRVDRECIFNLIVSLKSARTAGMERETGSFEFFAKWGLSNSSSRGASGWQRQETICRSIENMRAEPEPM